MSRYAVGTLFVILSALAFGTMSVLARKAFATGVTVEQLMLLRFSMAAAFLAAAVYATRRPLPKGPKLRELVVMGFGLYFLQSFALYNALLRIEAGLASLLLYLYPALVAVAAVVWLRERMTLPKSFALVLALVGVALTIGPVKGVDSVGVAWGVAAAVFYAAYVMAGSKAMKGVATLPATCIVIASAVVPYSALMVVQRQHLPEQAASYLWAFLLAISTVVAIAAFLAGLARVGPVDASTYSAIEPAVTAGLAFMLLGERLVVLQVVGGLIALSAVAYLAHASSKGAKTRSMSG